MDPSPLLITFAEHYRLQQIGGVSIIILLPHVILRTRFWAYYPRVTFGGDSPLLVKTLVLPRLPRIEENSDAEADLLGELNAAISKTILSPRWPSSSSSSATSSNNNADIMSLVLSLTLHLLI
jgi:hypothetical protein